MSRTPENTPPAIPETSGPEKKSAPDPEGTEPAPPLNRADRRKQAKKGLPGHVGPQNDPLRTERSARPHSKRQI